MRITRIFCRRALKCLIPLGLTFFLQNSLLSQSQKILFLGNGLINYSLTADFEELTEAAGYQVEINQYTPDSYILSFHNGWMGDETSLEKIKNENWDYIILQEQSFFPLVPVLKDHFTVPAIRGLKDKIERSRSCTQPILFMTWAWPKGGRFCNNIDSLGPSCSAKFDNFSQMQDAVVSTYTELAHDVDLSLAPVGYAWKLALEQNPHLGLFLSSTNLSSEIGSYLSGCVLFATIFQESPVGNKYLSGLDREEALLLQAIAETVVLDHREQWRITPQKLAHKPYFKYELDRKNVRFMNLSENATSYLWKFGDGSISNERQPDHIYSSFGSHEVCLSISGVLGCPRVYCETLVMEEIVRLYPNPFRDELIFEFQSNFSGPATIEIYDLLGKKITERRLSEPQNTSFRFSNLQVQAATVIVRISNGENSIIEKVLNLN